MYGLYARSSRMYYLDQLNGYLRGDMIRYCRLIAVCCMLLCGAVAKSQTLIGSGLQFFTSQPGKLTVVTPGTVSQTTTLTLPDSTGTLLIRSAQGESGAWLLGGNNLSGSSSVEFGSATNNNVVLIAGGTSASNHRLILNSTENVTSTTDGGEIRFLEPSASGSNYSSFKAAAQTSSVSYVLPVTKPVVGRYLKATGINGTEVTLSWEVAAGGVNHYVGEQYGGGVVFWVDETGNHGLIISMVDVGVNVTWSNLYNDWCGNTNDDDGKNNTASIIAQAGHTNSAAKRCDDYYNDDYGTGQFNDWYLPSMNEMKKIWSSLYEISKGITNYGAPATQIDNKPYWTSTENSATQTIALNFVTCHFLPYYKATRCNVRAIRSF